MSRYNEEFEELGELGTGEFGTVYKCRNRLDGIEYAIKRSKKPISGLAEEYVPSLRGRGGRVGIGTVVTVVVVVVVISHTSLPFALQAKAPQRGVRTRCP